MFEGGRFVPPFKESPTVYEADPELRLRFIVFRTADAAAVYFLTAAILLNFLVVVRILLENYINFAHHIKGKFDDVSVNLLNIM